MPNLSSKALASSKLTAMKQMKQTEKNKLKKV